MDWWCQGASIYHSRSHADTYPCISKEWRTIQESLHYFSVFVHALKESLQTGHVPQCFGVFTSLLQFKGSFLNILKTTRLELPLLFLCENGVESLYSSGKYWTGL